jgi:protein-disulfide isomerase
MKPVPTFRALSLLTLAAALGCHAQAPAASIVTGSQLPPAVAHKVEVLLRQKAQLPPGSSIVIGPATPSDVPGFDSIAVSFTSIDGQPSHPSPFLISTDGKTVAQFSKYDISADPRSLISADGRPARGGPATAPVLIVGFDDLECPYCARLHETIFPAITRRYGDKVRIVYKDFPIEQHPWAMRGAVDVNCLAAQSPAGYWNLVDYIHAHASDIGSDPTAKDKPADSKTDAPPDKTLERADAQLDKLTREQGALQHADAPRLDACLAKQDTTAIQASQQVATGLNVDSTPSLFINGEKIEGAVPIEFIFNVIDGALRSENITPPPPYVVPAPPAPAAKPSPTK